MAEAVAAPLANAVKKDSTALIVLGILTVILGVLAMMTPLMTGVAVALILGFLLIAAGITRTIFAFKCKSWGKGILVFVLGLLTLLVGLYMVVRPGLALATLALVLAFYFFIDGIFEIIEAFDLKPLSGWGWMLFGGIVSIVLGIMIWRGWPERSMMFVGILVGIKLIFAGWAMVGIGAAGRSVAGTAEDVVGDVKEAAQDAVESVKDVID
ncbi:MAG: DUF308 domain-containing protein [Thermoanaerobaculia bacterium]